jgi:phage terminase Nu1 subunit (DNA packaging protein)
MGEFVTLQDLSHILGIGQRHVQRLARDGVLLRSGRNRYHLAKSVQAFIRYATQSRTPEELVTDRRRLLAAQADKTSLEARKMAGQLIEHEDAKILFNQLAVVYVRALQAMPGRMAAVLSHLAPGGEIRAAAMAEIHTIRSIMADHFEQVAQLGLEAPPLDLTPKRQPKRRARK